MVLILFGTGAASKWNIAGMIPPIIIYVFGLFIVGQELNIDEEALWKEGGLIYIALQTILPAGLIFVSIESGSMTEEQWEESSVKLSTEEFWGIGGFMMVLILFATGAANKWNIVGMFPPILIYVIGNLVILFPNAYA